MLQTSPLEYLNQARQYLRQAKEELAKEDLRQASEKAGGAASQAVKAVAQKRDWEHRTHIALFRAVDMLVNETGVEELRTQFGIANALHMNFYEGCLSYATVRAHLVHVTLFVERLETIIDND